MLVEGVRFVLIVVGKGAFQIKLDANKKNVAIRGLRRKCGVGQIPSIVIKWLHAVNTRIKRVITVFMLVIRFMLL